MGLVWYVTLLGGLSARPAGEAESPPITHFRTQKTAALFAYLAFHSGKPQPREELIEIFWPDADMDAGRMSLRTALSALRKILGESLQADKKTTLLNAETDVFQFLNALRTARSSQVMEERGAKLSEAVERYGGPLLPGFYEDWVIAERDRLAEAYLGTLTMLADWHETKGDLPSAIECARKAVATDPLREEARLSLIRLLRQVNRPVEAWRQFADWEVLLKEQWDERPSEAMRSLIADLQGPASLENAPEPATILRLPATLGRFRGRRDDLAALVQRLSHKNEDGSGKRLFTLIGPGGIGKTRLAIETARRLGVYHRFEAAYFVSLATATTAEQVWKILAVTLGLTLQPAIMPETQVLSFLREHTPVLLLLDNLEQALPEATIVLEILLSGIPDLILLTTSRQRAAVPGEELIAVGPLPPKDAFTLFVDRARGISPDFFVADEEEIRALVAALEGFPLAIELVTGWVSVLTPREILAQLQKGRLNLPTDSKKEARHSSLTSAIAWSVSLLEPDLQRAFASLSVFRGGWDADAAMAVCQAGLRTLASLRERSLITAEIRDGRHRFAFHESLREYAQTLLTVEDRQRLEQAHIRWFQGRLANVSDRDLTLLHSDVDNLRAALHYADPPERAKLCIALRPFWIQRAYFREGYAATTDALHSYSSPSYDITSRLHLTAGILAYHLNLNSEAARHLEQAEVRGDASLATESRYNQALLALHNQNEVKRAKTLLEHCQEEYQHRSDELGQAMVLQQLGTVALMAGDPEIGSEHLLQAVALAQKLGRRQFEAQTLNNLGNAYHQQGLLDAARDAYERSLQIREELGLRLEIARTHIGLGNLATAQRDFAVAERHFSTCRSVAQEVGDVYAESVALTNLGSLFGEQKEFARSLPFAQAALQRKHQLGLWQSVALSLNNIGDIQTHLNQPERAARLHGAATALRESVSMPLGSIWQSTVDRMHEECRAALGEDAFRAAYAIGQSLTLEESVTLALGNNH